MRPDDSPVMPQRLGYSVGRTPPLERARPKRILHVIHGLVHGGMERVLVDLIERSDRARFDSHVLALEMLGPLADEVARHAPVHRSGPLSRWTMLWPDRLARQIRGIAPDVVHTHGRVWYKASLAARLAGVRRIIHTDHGRGNPDPWVQRRLDRSAAARTNVVVAVSQALAAHLRRRVVGPHARIDVITNGVDTERYRPRADDGIVRARFAIPSDAPVIGTVGRFDPIKAYDMMVEAFARLLAAWPLEAGPRPVLMFVGDGSERELIETTADRLGVREQVRITGLVSDVSMYHPTLTVFSLSSHSEGTSISLLEAMSAGVCPVVTDAGGNRACLGAGLDHRLVPTRDPGALAAAWSSALSDPGRRAVDARAARAHVERNFALRRTVARYMELYDSFSMNERAVMMGHAEIAHA